MPRTVTIIMALSSNLCVEVKHWRSLTRGVREGHALSGVVSGGVAAEGLHDALHGGPRAHH